MGTSFSARNSVALVLPEGAHGGRAPGLGHRQARKALRQDLQKDLLKALMLLIAVPTLVFLVTFGVLPVQASEPLAVASLDSVVVTATGAERALWGVPAAVSVVEGEKLQERTGHDVLELVRGVPGVSLSGVGLGGRKVLRLRGMESHQSLILIDGKRINPSDAVIGHSDFQHGWVPVEAIERIEVVRGPMSALYGSEALGGVINIITKSPGSAWQGSARLQSGFREDGRAGDRQQFSFSISGPATAQLGVSLHGSFQDQEATPERAALDVEGVAGLRPTELEGKEQQGGGLRLDYAAGAHNRFILEYQLSDEARWRDTLSRGRPPFHESRYDLDREHINLGHRGVFGKVGTRLNIYRSELAQKNSTNHEAVSATAPQTLTDDVVDGQLAFSPALGHQVTLGAELRQEKLQHEAFNGGDDSMSYRALYVQDEWQWLQQLNLTLGARVDDHELFGTEASPRLYAVYMASDVLSVRAGIGQAFRAPTLKQISPEYRFRGPHSFNGNPGLQPETSTSAELGFDYWMPGVGFGATLFQNRVDDLIVNQCAENCDARFGRIFEHVNVEDAEIRGLETYWKKELLQGIDLELSYTRLDTENRTTGNELPERPEDSASLRLAWAYAPWQFRTSIRLEHTGKQLVYVSGEEKSLPAYQLLHLALARDVGDRLTLRAGIDNLTDEQPADDSPYFSYPEQGRFISAGLDLSF